MLAQGVSVCVHVWVSRSSWSCSRSGGRRRGVPLRRGTSWRESLRCCVPFLDNLVDVSEEDVLQAAIRKFNKLF